MGSVVSGGPLLCRLPVVAPSSLARVHLQLAYLAPRHPQHLYLAPLAEGEPLGRVMEAVVEAFSAAPRVHPHQTPLGLLVIRRRQWRLISLEAAAVPLGLQLQPPVGPHLLPSVGLAVAVCLVHPLGVRPLGVRLLAALLLHLVVGLVVGARVAVHRHRSTRRHCLAVLLPPAVPSVQGWAACPWVVG